MTFGASWKTSVSGAAGVLVGLGMVGKIINGVLDGLMPSMEEVGAALAAIVTGVGLLFAKDAGVTGGTKVDPKATLGPLPEAPTTPPAALGLLLACTLLAGTACATLAGIQGSVPVDVGNGYVCKVVSDPVVGCSKFVSTVCTGPNDFTSTTSMKVPIHNTPDCP